MCSISCLHQVVDTDERLRSTLLHELCHAAVWLIDGVKNPPHGRNFKNWGRIGSSRFPDLPVTTCHAYKIFQPHKFKCMNGRCGVVYSRHTKKGLDVER